MFTVYFFFSFREKDSFVSDTHLRTKICKCKRETYMTSNKPYFATMFTLYTSLVFCYKCKKTCMLFKSLILLRSVHTLHYFLYLKTETLFFQERIREQRNSIQVQNECKMKSCKTSKKTIFCHSHSMPCYFQGRDYFVSGTGPTENKEKNPFQCRLKRTLHDKSHKRGEEAIQVQGELI